MRGGLPRLSRAGSPDRGHDAARRARPAADALARGSGSPLRCDHRGRGVRTERRYPPMFPGGMELGEEEREAVMRVLSSRRLIRFYGPDDPDGDRRGEVDEFEREFARRTGSEYALGVTSGT